jgi:hypothetical protein
MKKLVNYLLVICFAFQISEAQVKKAIITKNLTTKVPTNSNINYGKISTLKMTAFNPAIHGFKFANTFNGIDASTRYGGLCGGMVYAQLDYYYANMQIPQQNYAPSNRYPLQSYIYIRQAKSAQESNWDRWAELGVNPGGIRNDEFFGWGIEMKNPGDRMNELKAMIDSGKPAPLSLFHSDEAEKYGYAKGGDHQVLAIGYDFGRYKGDKGEFIGDFKIFVCDPNYPKQTMTLVADPINKCFHYLEGARNAWLTYFVNTKYEKMQPPTIETLDNNKTLYVKVGTGADNLRGGNDNLCITVVYKDGSRQVFPNVNNSATWIPRYDEVIPLNLNRTITDKSDIKQFILDCSFGGGWNGENWDMAKFVITTSNEFNVFAALPTTFERDGVQLIKRFTGDDKSMTINVR